jgi:hypothetical protein
VQWWIVTTNYSPHEGCLVPAKEWADAIRQYASGYNYGPEFTEHLLKGAAHACRLSPEQMALLGLSSDRV